MTPRAERWRGWLVRPAVRRGLVVAACAAWLASGTYTVPATSVAVPRLLGVPLETPVPPGIHWWWPRPIGRVDRADVTRTFELALGVQPADEYGRPEMSHPVESRWLTGDTNILQLRSKVSWSIADPRQFLFATEQPDIVLRLALSTAFTGATSRQPVDEILTSGRLVLREAVRVEAQRMLDDWRAGIRVLAVEIQVVEPPATVLAAFQEVQNARADRERLVSEAEAYANSTVPLARGEAEQRVNQARAVEQRRLDGAHADAGRFTSLLAEHGRAPQLLERRLYLETIERVLPRVRRYVLDPGSADSTPIRLFE